MEIEDEKFERPGSVGSIGKMLEQVKIDTTPKADLDTGRVGYFDSPQDEHPTEPIDFPTPRQPHSSRSGAPQISPIDESKHGMSFRHFLLDGGAGSPPTSSNLSPGRGSAESQIRSMGNDGRELRIDTAVGNEGGRTPT